MGEIVLGTYKPPPGVRPEDFSVPGPGLYEADFTVPDWMFPDLDVGRKFSFKRGENTITHIRTKVVGDVMTIRFRVEENGEVTSPTVKALIGEEIALGFVIRGILLAILGAVAAVVIRQVVEALREVRKLGETPAGIGLAALGIAGALVIAAKWKGP